MLSIVYMQKVGRKLSGEEIIFLQLNVYRRGNHLIASTHKLRFENLDTENKQKSIAQNGNAFVLINPNPKL